MSAEPTSVACPRCDVGIGEQCERPDGTPAKPHADRVKRAAHEARQRAAADVPEAIVEDRWKRLYRACRLELEQRGDWGKLAAEQLLAMTLNMRHADEARDTASHGAVVTGSTGQKAAHPLWRVAATLDDKALAQAKALKLTPDTRGTSVPEGANEAADSGNDEDADEFGPLDEVSRQRQAAQKRRQSRRS